MNRKCSDGLKLRRFLLSELRQRLRFSVVQLFLSVSFQKLCDKDFVCYWKSYLLILQFIYITYDLYILIFI